MNSSCSLPPLYVYVARLIRMYPFTHAVASYLPKWGKECSRKYNDPGLVAIADQIWADEKGHDQLILKDLHELKIPVKMALDQFPSRSVQSQISSFECSVSEDPLHLLAWLFYLEKKAVDHVTKEVLEGYHTMLGPYYRATRFWRVHSAVGPEVEHVRKRKEWIESFPSHYQEVVTKELARVAEMIAAQTFDLDFSAFGQFINTHAPHLCDAACQGMIEKLDRFHFPIVQLHAVKPSSTRFS